MEKITQIGIKLDEKTLERLDAKANKLRLNRSQMTRNLIDTGLDELDFLEKIGFLGMTLKGFDILESVKKALSDRKYKIDGNHRLIIEL